eukprot:g9463.t1
MHWYAMLRLCTAAFALRVFFGADAISAGPSTPQRFSLLDLVQLAAPPPPTPRAAAVCQNPPPEPGAPCVVRRPPDVRVRLLGRSRSSGALMKKKTNQTTATEPSFSAGGPAEMRARVVAMLTDVPRGASSSSQQRRAVSPDAAPRASQSSNNQLDECHPMAAGSSDRSGSEVEAPGAAPEQRRSERTTTKKKTPLSCMLSDVCQAAASQHPMRSARRGGRPRRGFRKSVGVRGPVAAAGRQAFERREAADRKPHSDRRGPVWAPAGS